jgi:hypothetical protein
MANRVETESVNVKVTCHVRSPKMDIARRHRSAIESYLVARGA